MRLEMLHALGKTKQLHLAISTTSTLHAVHYYTFKRNVEKHNEEKK